MTYKGKGACVRDADNRVDKHGALMCFEPFYESRFLYQICEEAPPRVPSGSPPWQDLRDQQG